MRTIVKASLRFRWIVLPRCVQRWLWASFNSETKVDVFPEFAPPEVEIQTIAVGNSSKRSSS